MYKALGWPPRYLATLLDMAVEVVETQSNTA